MLSINAGVCYTCVTGGRDDWRPPFTGSWPGIHSIRFTDETKATADGWDETRRIIPGYSTMLAAKFPKCLPHLFLGDFVWSVWMDGTLQYNTDLSGLAEIYLADHDVALYQHHLRHTALEEAQGVIAHRMDDAYRVQGQIMKYTMDHYPDEALYCGTVLLRRHTPAVAKFGDIWMAEILAGSIRDQISLPYALWKAGITPAVIPGNPFDGIHFTHTNHVAETQMLEDRKHELVRA